MRATLLATLLATSALTLTGCGQSEAGKTTIDLKDVPAEVMKVAKEKLPDVTFTTAWKKADGSYEVRGKAKNGKVREIDIKADGTVADIE